MARGQTASRGRAAAAAAAEAAAGPGRARRQRSAGPARGARRAEKRAGMALQGRGVGRSAQARTCARLRQYYRNYPGRRRGAAPPDTIDAGRGRRAGRRLAPCRGGTSGGARRLRPTAFDSARRRERKRAASLHEELRHGRFQPPAAATAAAVAAANVQVGEIAALATPWASSPAAAGAGAGRHCILPQTAGSVAIRISVAVWQQRLLR